MARQKIDHRGIRFGIWVNANGYAWQRVPVQNSEGEVEIQLAPAGMYREPDPRTIAETNAARQWNSRLGLDVARKAFNRFRALAETITRAETIGERSYTDEEGNRLIVSADTGLQLTISDEEARASIVDYANDFGPLWGDQDGRTLRDWQCEAAEFLTLFDISRSLCTSDFREFDKRIISPGTRGPEWQYRGGRPFVPLLTIAHEGQRTESKRARNALPETVDYFDLATSGSSRVRARMLLSREVNRKLAGGLSFHASLLNETKAAVSPHHLVHLLYLRLWLDTIDSVELEQQTSCLNCGRKLTGTRRRKYCDDTCRTEYHNRRRARSG